mmetsp:Transcript_28338/g.70169  ORF Transcript_28338/g.70169 Transcript_28338/m.70169 type:complete len:237 (-) Transcript_28338:77-787(-)
MAARLVPRAPWRPSPLLFCRFRSRPSLQGRTARCHSSRSPWRSSALASRRSGAQPWPRCPSALRRTSSMGTQALPSSWQRPLRRRPRLSRAPRLRRPSEMAPMTSRRSFTSAARPLSAGGGRPGGSAKRATGSLQGSHRWKRGRKSTVCRCRFLTTRGSGVWETCRGTLLKRASAPVWKLSRLRTWTAACCCPCPRRMRRSCEATWGFLLGTGGGSCLWWKRSRSAFRSPQKADAR